MSRAHATHRALRWILFAIGLPAAVFAALVARELYGPLQREGNNDALRIDDALIARGEYLAKIGNCAGCHTARGGEAMAGGRRIQTPFGAVVASNITPDKTHGIGAWSATDFYRALREGRSRDGRLLSPAFPYTNTTLVSREDADAMYAYFMNRVKPSSRANEPSNMSAFFDSQIALAAWRVLFFKPASYVRDANQSEPWNRGAYLANGLAHCTACHGARNVLGAPIAGREYAGSMMPLNDWYAPSLVDAREGSVAAWSNEDVVALLKHGIAPHASSLGPMADVVFKSTQFLSTDDANAIAIYLKSLPTIATRSAPAREAKASARGATLYGTHCASCHGDEGEGRPNAYPALAKNRAVTMTNPVNAIRVTLEGGFSPATPGNPAPYGMPPFYHLLKDDEIADVLTHIRTSWGNDAAPVTALDMANYRNALRTSR
jgi:mono/diheme cytochrome c family protein